MLRYTSGLLVVFCLLFLPLSASTKTSLFPPEAINGVLDLRAVDLNNSDPIKLTGEWEFYFNQFIEPEKFSQNGPLPDINYIHLPSSWNNYVLDGKKLTGTGFATYRLKILTGKNTFKKLSVSLPGWDSAFILYVNNTKIVSIGRPGKTKELSVPRWKPVVADIPFNSSVLDVVIHISNFRHARGGPSLMAHIGTEERILDMREKGVFMQMLTFGALCMIALYHLLIFFLRRSEKSALCFSLFTFCMAFRSLVVDEFCLMTLFPGLPWDPLLRLTYLTFTLGLAFFALYVYYLFSNDFDKKFIWFIAGIGFTYSLIVLFAPVMLFSALVIPFQFIIITVSIYGIGVIILAVLRKREDSLLFLTAFILYFLCIINDTLHHNQIINTAYIVPTGFLVFIFLQAVFLARRYSKAFIKIEELFQERMKLEGTAVTFQSLSYMDPLTNIANRRRLDEYLNQEWNRAAREKSNISMIMIDIDCFKQYNDRYGHLAGDKVLVLVAKKLETLVRRPADLIARYGGEEFAVLLPGTDLQGAVSLSEIIRKGVLDLQIPHEDSSVSDAVTVSLGCASSVPGSGEEQSLLIHAADKALYRAKQNCRNKTAV